MSVIVSFRFSFQSHSPFSAILTFRRFGVLVFPSEKIFMRGHSLTITVFNNGNFKKHLLEQNLLRLGKQSNINNSKLINAMPTFSSPVIVSSSELQSFIFSQVSLCKFCAVGDVIKVFNPLQPVISRYSR
ncbi:disease resistance protein [Trifolium repens]|nr:disease resistance protein [Trifolium repens]